MLQNDAALHRRIWEWHLGKKSNAPLFHSFRFVGSPWEINLGKETAMRGVWMFQLFCRLALQQMQAFCDWKEMGVH